jgi:hypothetical protein
VPKKAQLSITRLLILSGEILSLELARMMGLKNVPCATLLPVRPTDRWHGDLGAIGWDAETNTVVAAIEWIPGMQQRCDNILPVNSWGPA